MRKKNHYEVEIPSATLKVPNPNIYWLLAATRCTIFFLQ